MDLQQFVLKIFLVQYSTCKHGRSYCGVRGNGIPNANNFASKKALLAMKGHFDGKFYRLVGK